MARIAGVDIPLQKRIEVALTYVKGIGPTLAKKILSELKISPDTRVKDLTEDEVAKMSRYLIENEILVEGELRRVWTQNIRRLKDIKSYRGLRHFKGLPVRGQSTRSNARTRKGKKKTVGGLKRKLTKT